MREKIVCAVCISIYRFNIQSQNVIILYWNKCIIACVLVIKLTSMNGATGKSFNHIYCLVTDVGELWMNKKIQICFSFKKQKLEKQKFKLKISRWFAAYIRTEELIPIAEQLYFYLYLSTFNWQTNVNQLNRKM